MSLSERYEHPEYLGKSKTAGLNLQFSHARSKLRVATCGKLGLESCDYNRTAKSNLIASAGVYFPCTVGFKMQ